MNNILVALLETRITLMGLFRKRRRKKKKKSERKPWRRGEKGEIGNSGIKASVRLKKSNIKKN